MTGHYLHLVEKRDAVLSTARMSPAARARALGKPHWLPVAKEHRIVVDLKASTRTVETKDHAPPKPETKPENAPPPYPRHRTKHCDILNAVAEAFGVTVCALLGPLRSAKVAQARFAAMRLIYDRVQSSPHVGRSLGRRDHSTVLSGLLRAEKLLVNDPEWTNRYHDARERVTGGK